MKLFQFKIQKGGKEKEGVGRMKEKREGGRRKQRGRKIGKDRSEREGGGVKGGRERAGKEGGGGRYER